MPACMLRENTAVCTLCFLVLSASEQMNKQSRLWNSKPLHRTSFWSESKTPADFWYLCVSAFLFCRLQLNDRLNGIWFCDDSFLGKQSETTPLKKQGQERHSGKTAERKIMSISVASIGLWPHNPNPQPEGVWTNSGRAALWPCQKIKHKKGDDNFEQRKE